MSLYSIIPVLLSFVSITASNLSILFIIAISHPIDLTEIQIEVGIYLSETMVGSLRLIKTDGTYGDYGSSNDDLNKPKSISGQEFSIVIGGAF